MLGFFLTFLLLMENSAFIPMGFFSSNYNVIYMIITRCSYVYDV